MTLSSAKESLGLKSLPRSLSFILTSIVLLAVFLIGASRLLISYPISSTIREYIVGFDGSVGDASVNGQSAPSFKELATAESPVSLLELDGLEAISGKGPSFQNGTDHLRFPSGSPAVGDEKSQLSENSTKVFQVLDPPGGPDIVNPGAGGNGSTSLYTAVSAAPPPDALHGYPKNNVSGMI